MATLASEQASIRPCLALGADAGGTKIAIRWSDGAEVHRHDGPSMNLRLSTPPEFAAHLATHIREALNDAPLDAEVRICVGAAGAGTPMVAEALCAELAEALSIPTEQVRVVADAHIALKAGFPQDDGILLIAGTGSGCYALNQDGALIRAGGWGPGLEDPGSGSELGRSAVKHLLSGLEAGTLDALSQCVAQVMGLQRPSISGVLDTYYHSDFHPASLAPAIMDLFESGDSEALALIQRQCAALAVQCHRLVRSLESSVASRIAVAGGLTNRKSYISELAAAVQRVVPDAEVKRLERAPVDGALDWALTERNRTTTS